MLKTFLTPLLQPLIVGTFLSVLIIQPAGAALTRRYLHSIKLRI